MVHLVRMCSQTLRSVHLPVAFRTLEMLVFLMDDQIRLAVEHAITVVAKQRYFILHSLFLLAHGSTLVLINAVLAGKCPSLEPCSTAFELHG